MGDEPRGKMIDIPRRTSLSGREGPYDHLAKDPRGTGHITGRDDTDPPPPKGRETFPWRKG